MPSKIKLGSCLATSFLLVACNYSTDKTSGQPTTLGSPVAASDLNFQNVLQTSIQTSCFPCHASPINAARINLETYENILAHQSAISSAVSMRVMPDSKGGTMTEKQRGLLLRWLAAGAPRDAIPSPTSVPGISQ